MDRMKTFFKYLLLVVGFFIVSQVLIRLCLYTSYEYINFEDISDQYIITGEAKAKNIDGFVKCTVMNPKSEVLKNKYIKIDYYTKRETLLGTDYIETGEIGTNDKKEFEISFEYDHVDNVKINIVDNKDEAK